MHFLCSLFRHLSPPHDLPQIAENRHGVGRNEFRVLDDSRSHKSPENVAVQRIEKTIAVYNPEVVGSSHAPATTKTPLSSRKAVFFFHFCNFGRRPRFPDTGVTQTVTQTGQKIGPEAAFPPPGFLSFLWRQRAFARTFPMVFAASFWAAVVTWA